MPGGPEAPASPLSPLLRAFLVIAIVFMVFMALHLAAGVLVPVVEALVVWFVLNAMARGVGRLPVVGPRIPRFAALVVSAVLVFVIGALVVQRSIGTAAAIAGGTAGLQQALDPLIERAAAALGMPRADLVETFVAGLGIESLVRQVAAALFGLINQFGVVAIYVGFLLVDQQFFEAKLRALTPDPVRRADIRALIRRIAEGIQAYLWVMTLMSALTAALSYGVLRLMGVEHAGFLTTAIFFLNFIPTIGSILGTLLPAVFALLQFQALGPVLAVLAGVGAVQFVIGNLLLPKVAGNALNISLFVTIFALFGWGALWGVTGMFVAMPLTAMLIITFSNFAATRPLAVILSRTGELDEPAP